MRTRIYKMELEFLGGEPIENACSTMYNLLCEHKCNVSTVFNGVKITMERVKP